MKGGRTKTTWEGGWNSGKTKTIRVPEALAESVLEYARKLDADCLVTGNTADEQEIIVKAIAAYIELKRQSYHPNQHSQALDINTRPWDEMRKFRAIVQDHTQKLGLKNE